MRPGSLPAVRQCHALVSSILKGARKPFAFGSTRPEGVELPTAPKKPERYLPADEVAAIRGSLDGQNDLMLDVEYETGPRWGELAKLHVQRLDLRRQTVRVVEVATRCGSVKAYPKSGMSYRTVPLTTRLCERLAVHVEGKCPTDLVFIGDPAAARTHEHSTWMLDYTNWRQRVSVPAVAAAKIPAPAPAPPQPAAFLRIEARGGRAGHRDGAAAARSRVDPDDAALRASHV